MVLDLAMKNQPTCKDYLRVQLFGNPELFKN